MLTVLVELWGVGGLDQLAVDPRAHESLADHLLEDLAVLALAPLNDRGEKHETGSIRAVQQAIHHLLHGLWPDRDLAVRAPGHADRRPQQTQVVVDLGDCTNGGARVPGGCLLLDRDGRR